MADERKFADAASLGPVVRAAFGKDRTLCTAVRLAGGSKKGAYRLTMDDDATALAYVWENRVAEHVAAGRLIKVLDDWCQPEEPLYLYYPSRRHMSAGFRALIEAIRAE